MKKNYRLPIVGTVLNTNPLTGLKSDPICPIPLDELPGIPLKDGKPEGYGGVSLEYNIDEDWCLVEIEASQEFHGWLTSIFYQLADMKEAKGWKLDKSKLEKK